VLRKLLAQAPENVRRVVAHADRTGIGHAESIEMTDPL
jgi:hypothetical protein